MKKIIVATICSFFVYQSFAGAPSGYTPPKKSINAATWIDNDDTYSTPLEATLYPDLSSQLNHNTAGSYSNTGAIGLWVARKIYENGAYICPVQIQGMNEKRSWYTWIDYLWLDDGWNCETLCKTGYSGAGCKDYDERVSCPNKKIFDGYIPYNYDLIKFTDNSNNGQKRIHTQDMEVLSFTNATGDTSETASSEATHVVLGVTKMLDHGVMVAPIKIIGKREKVSETNINEYKKSWITSAQSNGRDIILCQPGYAANTTNTNCVKTTECKINMDNMCEGYKKSDYDEDTQVLKIRNLKPEIDQSGGSIALKKTSCTYFECKSGYIKIKGDKGCTDCSTNARQGVNRKGQCEICKDSQVFDTKQQKCTDSTPLTKEQLKHGISRAFDCWREMSSGDYSQCVKCNGTFNTTTKGCE